MIIELSPSQRLVECLENQNGKYDEILKYLWTAYQCKTIQKRYNGKYNINGLFDRSFIDTTKWITTDPQQNIFKLWREFKCSYCCNEIIPTRNSEGDHIVGRGNLSGAAWQVPCCHSVLNNCQSSKGSKDLLQWWYVKQRNIENIRKEILSIYIRAKFRVLSNNKKLYDIASPVHHYYLKQLWSLVS